MHGSNADARKFQTVISAYKCIDNGENLKTFFSILEAPVFLESLIQREWMVIFFFKTENQTTPYFCQFFKQAYK